MGFNLNEIFKKSFLEGWAGTEIDGMAMLGAMCTSLLFAVYIFLFYRVVTKRSFYSQGFAISLSCITLITAAIILTIQSSIVISLGMVGALSIVRFRTAIKDPMDLMFLFWAISNGIMCGAGLAEFALVLGVFITILVLILQRFPAVKPSMILVINADDADIVPQIKKILVTKASGAKLCNRKLSSRGVELIFELRCRDEEALVNEIKALAGVNSISLVANDGNTIY